jgi:hypothetical protein
MNGHDFQFEEFHISEAIGHSFHGFNFIPDFPLDG